MILNLLFKIGKDGAEIVSSGLFQQLMVRLNKSYVLNLVLHLGFNNFNNSFNNLNF